MKTVRKVITKAIQYFNNLALMFTVILLKLGLKNSDVGIEKGQANKVACGQYCLWCQLLNSIRRACLPYCNRAVKTHYFTRYSIAHAIFYKDLSRNLQT